MTCKKKYHSYIYLIHFNRKFKYFRDGNHGDLQPYCSDTVELIATTAICQQVADNIKSQLKKVFKDLDNTYLAVRSSASGNCRGFGFMVFSATFNNISVISWRSVLLVEETEVPRENHRPVA